MYIKYTYKYKNIFSPFQIQKINPISKCKLLTELEIADFSFLGGRLLQDHDNII